jgi:hypothetical protein
MALTGNRRRRGLAVLAALTGIAIAVPAASQAATVRNEAHELSAQTARPRVTVTPRTAPGPNAKRYCRSWLEKEYRVSGTVIVPKMQCWWQ